MDIYEKSVELLLNSQSEYGSFRACPTFDTYRFCWLRDGSFIAHALDAAGKPQAAGKFFRWVDATLKRCRGKIERIETALAEGKAIGQNDLLHTRYTLEGFDEAETGWGNFQLDGYGTWLWALAEHAERGGEAGSLEPFCESIGLSVRYLKSLWHYPNYDIWEENGDKIHASTLACLYGGLTAVNRHLRREDIARLAAEIRAYLLTNCVKNGAFVKYIGSDEVDASLLWLNLPFQVVDLNDEVFRNTVRRIENELLTNGGVHRYREDTYYGGGEWILLSCWLGWYYARSGQKTKAQDILNWVRLQAEPDGSLPEQVSRHLNRESEYSVWVERWGVPASPLLWSHAMYIVLQREIGINRIS